MEAPTVAEIEAALSNYGSLLERLSAGCLRSKPVFGGAFGVGGFSLCSYNACSSGGLDHVLYMVRHNESHFVLSGAETKGEALSLARRTLTILGAFAANAACVRFAERIKTEKAEDQERRRLQWEARRASVVVPIHGSSVPKRRRAIFEASDGKCHYCGAALTLDGRWHIEHKMPRALLGGSEQSNLVASCVTCNLRKKDSTDIEFKAKLIAEGGAA